MSVVSAPSCATPDAIDEGVWSRRIPLLIACFTSLLILMVRLDDHTVHRTQEARVLETAREMHEGASWLIPHVNGQIRMRKPPLAYWLSALSFRVLGISDGVGRIPAVIAGWLTLLLTYLVGRWLFGARAGFLAAAALLGSVLFFRFARLGETDIYVALFVTAAIYTMWRAFDGSVRSRALWLNLSGAAIGLTILTKGPPAAYPILFLVAMCAIERRWEMLRRWLTSGAPLVIVLIALPWFVYAWSVPESRQWVDDLANSAAGGGGHAEWFFEYFAQILLAAGAWCGLLVAALIAGIARWRFDSRVRGLLAWSAVIFLPLCMWGNKQPHYLLPLIPPLMLLVGWAIDTCLRPDTGGRLRNAVAGTMLITSAAVCVAAPAILLVAFAERGWISRLDVTVALTIASVMLVVLLTQLRRGLAEAVTRFAFASILLIGLVVGIWEPSLDVTNERTAAQALVAQFGSGPYAFYPGPENLALCFHLRSIVPVVTSDKDLQKALRANPNLVLITSAGKSHRQPSHPSLLELRTAIPDGDRTFWIYQSNSRQIIATSPP